MSKVVTQEAIEKAAESLIARGEKVTNKAVIAELGGGSMSTVVPLVAAWKKARDEKDALAEVQVPEALADAASQLVASIWRSAMAEASAGHDALRKELLSLKSELEQQQAEMLELIRISEAKSDELAKLLAEEKSVLESVQANLVLANQANSGFMEKAAAAEARASAAEARIEKAEARADKAEERAEKAEARADRAEARASKKS